MPENNQYTQYNVNVQAAMSQHAMQYMVWYDAAVVLYAFALVVFVVYWFFRNRAVLSTGLLLVVAGLVSQGLSLGMRAYYSHHVPWNDLYGSLSMVSFWAIIMFLIFGSRFNLWFAGPLVLGFTDALLAYAKGWNKGLAPLVPSLQSPWIFIHVPIVLASYAAFLIGFATSIVYLLKKWDEDRAASVAGKSLGAAVASQRAALGRPAWLSWLDTVPSSSRLDVISYRVIAVGEILLTAGIILGGVWAHMAWGSYWQ
ncbi:MAG TPA: cytochrome c biogenesis protein CcsA, partial [Candidatus Eremiobacteraceae bacterium]|nr:cytochrome c biogenesis protein CcsA [Candidatus Eremiobacteraceae bacterium]